jgi:cellulose synthase/poly-beta-1,6-N-acetylglucosamine synthase-like glycosyltransferase
MTFGHFLYFGFYIAAMLVLVFFGIHKYILLYTRHKYRIDPVEPARAPHTWPTVTVQLPIFNERYVVERLLRAVVKLDYPKDRLHIQVLDDSTDNTAELSKRLVNMLKRKGFHIEHIHRKDRTGFKAGALANGLQQSDAEFIAIFDADFVPQSEFLKQTVPYLVSNPKIGMLQARWGHINRNYSLLTRLQALFLDAHFLIEHYARNRSGKFFNFNGTAGIWRKQAILDAGGWQHDTLTEDLDLSYRAQLAGWKFLYLPDVVVPAELPVEINAYKNQQHRWAKGSVQTALKLIPQIWRSDLPLLVKCEATIHLTSNFSYLMMTIPALLLIPVLNLQVEFDVKMAIIPYLLTFFAATMSVVFYYGYAAYLSCGKLFPYILYIPALMGLGIGLSINNGRAVIEAVLRQQSDFKRTPKFKIENRKDSYRRKRYKPVKSKLQILEFLFAGYFTFGLVYFMLAKLYVSMPFFLLFLFGFLYISLASFTLKK